MLNVKSEIAPLKKVLVHPPGRELLNLIPSTLEELLFEDIPYLKKAKEEHKVFTDAMEREGIEVVTIVDLMVETLEGREDLRSEFIHRYLKEGFIDAKYYQELLFHYFTSFEEDREMILKTMEGINNKDVGICQRNCLINLIQKDNQMIINPMPNLYFTRDPFAVIGNGVSINRMHSLTRSRETIYGDFILRHHPEFKEGLDIYYERDDLFSIEGGDIFNFSKNTIGIGISQRTTAEAIQDLAHRVFYEFETEIEKILAFNIPSLRAFMHLDTVFTQIDRNAFLYHPGIMGSLKIFIITKDDHGGLRIKEDKGDLERILARNLDLDNVELFPCAGGDYIKSQREQWNNGSNSLALSPKHLVVYDRNESTNDMLKEAGYNLIEIPSSELSRGRGGPRCMTMPLVRREQE